MGYLWSALIAAAAGLVPVIGYADDAIIVALALRSVTRRAGSEALDKRWPGPRKAFARCGALRASQTEVSPPTRACAHPVPERHA